MLALPQGVRGRILAAKRGSIMNMVHKSEEKTDQKLETGSLQLVDVIPPSATQLPFSIRNQSLSLEAFRQICGHLAGTAFVKVVVDRSSHSVHFLNHSVYQFHANYIGDSILGISSAELEFNIDKYNQSFYRDEERRFFLGIIALHEHPEKQFFTLETVEVDTMNLSMLQEFFATVKKNLDPSIALYLKPANHFQENYLNAIDKLSMPRIYAHELFASSTYIPLNTGKTKGRVRAFRNVEEYQSARASLEWYDIIAMPKVPDDIPRLAGIINAEHTTPLSHTNVLASGWQIPNSIQIGILDEIEKNKWNDSWVEYHVDNTSSHVRIKSVDKPVDIEKPAWKQTKIKLDEPEVRNVPIVSLEELRMDDRFKYGTKAANLGELHHVLNNGSERILGFYQVKRPPRANLLPYLAKELNFTMPEKFNGESVAKIYELSQNYLRTSLCLSKGIAIPFSIQEEFLESSPVIQQSIGKLKMALELGARQVDALCINLQHLIMETKIPLRIKNYIDSQIMKNLGGVSSFVVRSSSNAEDLEGFSAAGIYESINHVTTANTIFESIKQVWASVLSPRSVRLRQEVGISLDDVYMGVVVQEEIPATMGGVLVTSNPANRSDFRNVYMNISTKSAVQVVQGTEIPYQYLFNTVEGGGRTLALGSSEKDLSDKQKSTLQRLAFCGRFLQSHFSPDYTFNAPVDIEWLVNDEGIFILQLRPYTK
jgi:hypothetical protein